jgi:isocitrate dehydrogenase (NAD+)
MIGSQKFRQTIAEGKTITGDLGGTASTSEYTSAIIAKLGKA